jgi:TonB family protein
MKTIIILLSIAIQSFNLQAQVKIIGDTLNEGNGKYILSNHPTNRKNLICKFFTNDNLLKYKYEFSTALKVVETKFINDYISKNQIILDGPFIEYYDSGDTLLSVQFKKGNKVGKQLKYNKDKTLADELLIVQPNELVYSTFYPSGQKKMQFYLMNEKKTGDELHYDENGNVKVKIHYASNHMEDTLIEYYPNKKIKRKEKYVFDKMTAQKCFDENGNESQCKPLIGNLRLDYMNEKMQELKSGKIIKSYLLNYDISFNCIITAMGKIKALDISSLPDSLHPMVQDWLMNKTIWNPAYFAEIPVESHINIIMTNLDSTYSIIRKPYTLDANNHYYCPTFQIKANRYSFYKEANDSSWMDAPFVMVEEMPLFNGESSDSARKYIAQHIMYPVEAAKAGIQGTVFVQFVIAKDGTVRNIIILRGVHPALDAEAIRVIESMPKWRPGYQRGEPVNVQFTFPVNFVLQ